MAARLGAALHLGGSNPFFAATAMGIARCLPGSTPRPLPSLKSKLEDAGRRGYNPGIIFWKEVKAEQAYQAVKART
jgi:hypothetical protein